MNVNIVQDCIPLRKQTSNKRSMTETWSYKEANSRAIQFNVIKHHNLLKWETNQTLSDHLSIQTSIHQQTKVFHGRWGKTIASIHIQRMLRQHPFDLRPSGYHKFVTIYLFRKLNHIFSSQKLLSKERDNFENWSTWRWSGRNWMNFFPHSSTK